ncbi:MAG TPA: sigma-70 family RNA polymerase sigma factor [Candidatus Tumulicola sp.]|nr:sigma-70 family RNA polymerase sigma factor [Candidatus Tumulicola sp.]
MGLGLAPAAPPFPRDPTLEACALHFVKSRCPHERERICDLAMPLVRRLATSLLRRLPTHFTADDLIGDGCVGLLRAIERFDPSFGASFETWAARLIRGAMLNGLRRMDIVPERVRRDARVLDAARWRLAQGEGKAPDDKAAARGAGLDQRRLASIHLALRSAAPASLDASVQPGEEGPRLGDRIACESPNPAAVVTERITRGDIGRAVTELPDRERYIVASFYGRSITFREIGQRLGISKQRVSQLHARALSDLKSALTGRSLEA